MKTWRLHTNNAEETQKVAAYLGEVATEGTLIRLEGQLGAGKTTFTKGLAKGLGIKRVVKSPTYTLIREYDEGRLPLYHMDLYRLEDGGAGDLGLEEYFESDGVSVVEWGSMAEDVLPERYLLLHLQVDGEEGLEREMSFEAHGEVYEEMIDRLVQKIDVDSIQ